MFIHSNEIHLIYHLPLRILDVGGMFGYLAEEFQMRHLCVRVHVRACVCVCVRVFDRQHFKLPDMHWVRC
jgi:hypothetical protein